MGIFSPGRPGLLPPSGQIFTLSWPGPAAVFSAERILLATSTFVQGRALPYLHPVQGGLSLAPNFLPYPKFVVSWLLSNTHPSGSSLYSCTTSLYQHTYSRKNFHLGSYGGLRPPVEMLFRLPLRLSSLQSQLDRKKMSSSISCLPYLTIRSIYGINIT